MTILLIYFERRCSDLEVSAPTLPRRRRAPKRFEIGESAPEYPDTAQEHYRRIYFEVIDVLVAAIQERFEQRGFCMLQKLETILIEKTPPSDVTEEVIEFYGTDLRPDRLKVQLTTLHSTDTIPDLQAYLKGLNDVEKEYYYYYQGDQIDPCNASNKINALSERSFSALRRIKTWLRTTMDQVRLNSCMTLHVHKTKTDSLPLTSIGNDNETVADYIFLDNTSSSVTDTHKLNHGNCDTYWCSLRLFSLSLSLSLSLSQYYNTLL